MPLPCRVVILSAACTLAACTTELQVVKTTQGNPAPASGWTYDLPFVQFDLTATRTYVGCPPKAPQPVVTLAVAGTNSIQADPDEAFSIDPMSLAAATKIWDLKLQWFANTPPPTAATAAASPAGGAATPAPPPPTASWMLQSINASSEDRTAQVISAGLTSIGTLATTIAAHGAAGENKSAPATCVVTDPVLKAALAQKKALDDAVASATDQLKRATQKLNLTTTLASAGRSRLDGPTLSLLAAATDAVTKATAAQQKAATAAAQNQAKLTSTTKFTWPPNGTLTGGVQQIKVPGAFDAVKKFLTSTALTPADASLLGASLRLEPLGPLGGPTTAAEVGNLQGIRYRAPVPGRLIVCFDPPPPQVTVSGPPTPQNSRPIDETVVAGNGSPDMLRLCAAQAGTTAYAIDADAPPVWSGPAPQLGPVKVLPYHNGPFQNNLMVATFSADGSLATAEYGAKSSTAETVAGSLSDASKALTGAVKGIVTGPTTYQQLLAANATARNTVITQQTGLITQATALTTAEQVGLLQANTALLNAQVAYDTAQAALAKAQGGSPGP